MMVSQVPGMPVEIRKQFESSRTAAIASRAPVYVPRLAPPEPEGWSADGSTIDPRNDDPRKEPFDFVADLQNRIDLLISLTERTSTEATGISIDNDYLSIVVGEIELAKAHLQTEPNNQIAQKQFQKQIELLMLTAVGLRQANQLIQQDQADAAEILLLAYMGQNATKQWLTDELWNQAIAIVSDRDGRLIARKRALIHSWRELDDDTQPGTTAFIGYWSLVSGEWSLVTQWTQRAQLDHLAATLMRLLEHGRNLSETERMELLKQRWPGSPQGFEAWGVYVPIRIDDPSDAFSPDVHQLMTPLLPGDQWLAGWEDVGAKWSEGE